MQFTRLLQSNIIRITFEASKSKQMLSDSLLYAGCSWPLTSSSRLPLRLERDEVMMVPGQQHSTRYGSLSFIKI